MNPVLLAECLAVAGGGNNLPGQTSRCDTAACSAPGDSETNQVGSDVETTLQERLVSVERTNSELERECAQLKEGAADRGRWMEERDVLRAERESLLRMLQNLQEELTTSEDMRMRMASAQEATGNWETETYRTRQPHTWRCGIVFVHLHGDVFSTVLESSIIIYNDQSIWVVGKTTEEFYRKQSVDRYGILVGAWEGGRRGTGK